MLSKVVSSNIFKAFGMMRPRIEPRKQIKISITITLKFNDFFSPLKGSNSAVLRVNHKVNKMILLGFGLMAYQPLWVV